MNSKISHLIPILYEDTQNIKKRTALRVRQSPLKAEAFWGAGLTKTPRTPRVEGYSFSAVSH